MEVVQKSPERTKVRAASVVRGECFLWGEVVFLTALYRGERVYVRVENGTTHGGINGDTLVIPLKTCVNWEIA